MTAMAYEPFVLRWDGPELRLVEAPRVRSMIERVPADKRVASRLARHRQLGRDGWSVMALLAPDSKTVLLIACRSAAGAQDG